MRDGAASVGIGAASVDRPSGAAQPAEHARLGLLEQGAPLRAPGLSGDGSQASALMTAAAYEQPGFVRLLLARGADVTLREERGGRTALDFADDRRNEALVRVLGQAMADASPPDSPIRHLWGKGVPFSRYNFVERVTQNDLEAARLFLAGGMDVNARGRSENHDDQPAIAHAARAGNVEMVRLLICGARPGNKPDTRQALEYSVGKGHAEVAKTLLERGADPRAIPVYNALRHLEIAALLLEHGADLNGPSGRDQVPALVRVLDTWDTAVDRTTRKLWVKFLLDHGANVHDRGGGLRTALDLARAWGDAEVVQWITDAAARTGAR